MILRHNKRGVPLLNTTSTADISFILLVFFLVITSMDVDKGLSRQLPPIDNKQQQQPTDINKNNVMDLKIDAHSRLTLNDKPVKMDQLRQAVERFVAGSAHRSSHIITLAVDRSATYDAYFTAENEIVAADNALRNQCAMKLYGRVYERCTKEQREQVRRLYPQRLTETMTGAVKGGAQ